MAAPEFSKICPGPGRARGELGVLAASGPALAEPMTGRYILKSRRLVSSTVLRLGIASSFRSLSVAVSILSLLGTKDCGTEVAVSELRLARGKPLKPSDVGEAVIGGRCSEFVRYEAIP